jgi:outer membrane protein assembly factor BamD (BamD/ComL family)
MTLGDFYFSRRQMSLAAEMYEIFVENYPRSVHVGKARKRLIFAHLASFKGPEFDAGGLDEARTRLQELRAVDPVAAQQIGAEALITRIEESNARKLYVTARWYQKTKDYIAAELTLRRLLQKHPRSVAAADGVRLVREILPHLPERILAEAPDYDALAAAILGPSPDAKPEAESAKEPHKEEAP